VEPGARLIGVTHPQTVAEPRASWGRVDAPLQPRTLATLLVDGAAVPDTGPRCRGTLGVCEVAPRSITACRPEPFDQSELDERRIAP
jgi:hypothetical protein